LWRVRDWRSGETAIYICRTKHARSSYTRRVVSAGLREYFFYFGGDADLSKIASALKEKYPEYRIESEAKPDPKWDLCLSWIKTAPHG